LQTTDNIPRHKVSTGITPLRSLVPVIIFALLGCAESRPNKPVDRLVLGKRHYLRRCLSCHQADGRGYRGRTRIAADLTKVDGVMAQDDAVLFAKIMKGVEGPLGRMPAQAPVLTEDQLHAILDYIRHDFLPDPKGK